MVEAKASGTPIGTRSKLYMNEPGPKLNETMYRGIIGSLLYLTASKPEIVLIIGICARVQACPK